MIQDTKRAFLNLDLCHPNAYSRNTQQYEGNVLELASKITKIKSDSNQQTLYKFIEDVLSNIGKSGKRWSDSTQTLFATVLNYGGKKIAQMLSKDLCGPSTQTMYRQARMSYLLPMSIENRAFAYASNLYKIWKFKGPFILAIDGTVIIPSLRIRSNQIIGFASNETFHVTTADEIVNLLHVRKIVKANQANLILLVPVIDGVPWCIISIQPVVKGIHSFIHRCFLLRRFIKWRDFNCYTIIILRASQPFVYFRRSCSIVLNPPVILDICHDTNFFLGTFFIISIRLSFADQVSSLEHI